MIALFSHMSLLIRMVILVYPKRTGFAVQTLTLDTSTPVSSWLPVPPAKTGDMGRIVLRTAYVF